MQPSSHTTEELPRAPSNVERLLLVLESHVARVLSNEEADEALMRSIVDAVMSWVDRHQPPCEGERDLVRQAHERLREASIPEEIAHGRLELVAAVRRYLARIDADAEADDAPFRAAFTELAHEAGCDCDYE